VHCVDAVVSPVLPVVRHEPRVHGEHDVALVEELYVPTGQGVADDAPPVGT